MGCSRGLFFQERGCKRVKSEVFFKILEAVKALPDADREQLLTYLRSLKGTEGSSTLPAASQPEAQAKSP